MRGAGRVAFQPAGRSEPPIRRIVAAKDSGEIAPIEFLRTGVRQRDITIRYARNGAARPIRTAPDIDEGDARCRRRAQVTDVPGFRPATRGRSATSPTSPLPVRKTMSLAVSPDCGQTSPSGRRPGYPLLLAPWREQREGGFGRERNRDFVAELGLHLVLPVGVKIWPSELVSPPAAIGVAQLGDHRPESLSENERASALRKRPSAGCLPAGRRGSCPCAPPAALQDLQQGGGDADARSAFFLIIAIATMLPR